MSALRNDPAMFTTAGEASIPPLVSHAQARGHNIGFALGRHQMAVRGIEKNDRMINSLKRENAALEEIARSQEATLDRLDPGWRKRIGGDQ